MNAGPALPLQSNTVFAPKPEMLTLVFMRTLGSINVPSESCTRVACLVFTAYAMVLQGNNSVLHAALSSPIEGFTETEMPVAA
jgi:hypothetical protein